MGKHDKGYYGPDKSAEIQAAELSKMGADRLQEMINAGVKRVEWLSAGTGDECKHCRKMNGKRMKIEDVKFTEHPDCEHPSGCRCCIIAIG